jgi:hypothetical protein
MPKRFKDFMSEVKEKLRGQAKMVARLGPVVWCVLSFIMQATTSKGKWLHS